ncbi:MAG: 50S ribosomal protein L25 [Sorangiineae bacterium]|nr:50S ribosomal protein L25 [Polyangiaceae bacterium]MEB2322119.1 50S ribosomal protein L25 [Sorangiineae bacterium]
MELVKIAATRRQDFGKGPARQLRREGKIPAVAYGKGQTAETLAVAPKELTSVLTSERGRNTVIELLVEGEEKRTVLLSDYQYHPLSRELLHADFIQIGLDEPVDVEVPLVLEGKPKGVVMGGVLRQVYRKLPIRCLPERIPVKIVYDVTELDLDQHVATRDLSVPEGVSVRLPETQTIAGVVTESKHAEAEEAAPAAGAAPAAAPAAATPAKT